MNISAHIESLILLFLIFSDCLNSTDCVFVKKKKRLYLKIIPGHPLN